MKKMVVKIIIPSGSHGDACVELSLEEAKEEIENAAKNGYIPTYNGKQVTKEQLKDGQDLKFYPTGRGG